MPVAVRVTKTFEPSSEAKLRRSGADHVILPAAIGAHRIANLITRPSAEDFLASHGACGATSATS